MALTHHQSIRKYTAALIDLFNDLEIEYENSSGSTISKNIPITYSSKEKSHIIENKTAEQLMSGNYNVLPRANLSLSTMIKSDQRIKNKNLKINTVSSADTFSYMYNSVPYEFTFELSVACRGMNEASMIIEQVAPKFNPIINIDIWDGINLNEPTRVPVMLLDIGVETEEYDEFTSNIVFVSFGLSIKGNLYPPIQTIERIKEFKIYINEQEEEFFNRKSILGWDVDNSGSVDNPSITQVDDQIQYAPTLVQITSTSTLTVADNNVYLIFEDKDNKITELTFDWVILSGDATIQSSDFDKAIVTVNSTGNVQIQVTVTDAFGNFASTSNTFTV